MKNEILYAVISIALALLLLCIVAPYSEAQSRQVVPLNIIIVKSPDTSYNDQANLALEGLSRSNEVGVYFDIKAIRTSEDYLKVNDYKYYFARHFRWHDYAKKQKWTNDNILTLYILPPVILNGINYIGGISGGICTHSRKNAKRQFTSAIVRNKNDQGLDRKEQSRVAVFHEILHNLGAHHIDSTTNMMHPAALAYVSTYESMLLHPKTKRDVDRCNKLRKTNTRRLK